jgi:MFS family permease
MSAPIGISVPPTGLSPDPPVERPAHRDPNVLRWLGAFTASTVGDGIYFMALSWAAARVGGPAQAGLVLAVGSVPRAALMLGGGVLADRWGPRRVVIGSDAARCVFILGMAAALLFTGPSLWLLIALALVFGVVDALFLPAVGALPPRITTPGQLTRLQGLRGLATRVANVVGAPAGGLLVALGGSPAAFAVAGALFAVSLALLLAVRMSPLPGDAAGGSDHAALRDLLDGLRHIRRHRVLGPLLLTAAVSELGFVGPANIGLTLLARQRGWGAGGMGWIIAAFGVGAGGVSLLLAVRGRIGRAGRVMCLALLGGSFGVAGLAFAPSVALAALAGLCVGLLTGLGGALCAALIQTLSEPAYLGRVTSVSFLFSMGVAPLSYPVTGAAIGAWGTGPVYVASAALCAAGALTGLSIRALRRAELPHAP